MTSNDTAINMPSFNEQKTRLNHYIQAHLPQVAATGIQLESITDDYLSMSIPLSKNKNEMGQAFGTSLYTLSHMACWSALYLNCIEKIQTPKILTRDAQVRYRHPVPDDTIIAQCKLPNPIQWKGFFAHYKNTGKTSLTLTSRISVGKDVAVYFDGVFVLLDNTH